MSIDFEMPSLMDHESKHAETLTWCWEVQTRLPSLKVAPDTTDQLFSGHKSPKNADSLPEGRPRLVRDIARTMWSPSDVDFTSSCFFPSQPSPWEAPPTSDSPGHRDATQSERSPPSQKRAHQRCKSDVTRNVGEYREVQHHVFSDDEDEKQPLPSKSNPLSKKALRKLHHFYPSKMNDTSNSSDAEDNDFSLTLASLDDSLFEWPNLSDDEPAPPLSNPHSPPHGGGVSCRSRENGGTPVNPFMLDLLEMPDSPRGPSPRVATPRHISPIIVVPPGGFDPQRAKSFVISNKHTMLPHSERPRVPTPIQFTSIAFTALRELDAPPDMSADDSLNVSLESTTSHNESGVFSADISRVLHEYLGDASPSPIKPKACARAKGRGREGKCKPRELIFSVHDELPAEKEASQATVPPTGRSTMQSPRKQTKDEKAKGTTEMKEEKKKNFEFTLPSNKTKGRVSSRSDVSEATDGDMLMFRSFRQLMLTPDKPAVHFSLGEAVPTTTTPFTLLSGENRPLSPRTPRKKPPSLLVAIKEEDAGMSVSVLPDVIYLPPPQPLTPPPQESQPVEKVPPRRKRRAEKQLRRKTHTKRILTANMAKVEENKGPMELKKEEDEKDGEVVEEQPKSRQGKRGRSNMRQQERMDDSDVENRDPMLRKERLKRSVKKKMRRDAAHVMEDGEEVVENDVEQKEMLFSKVDKKLSRGIRRRMRAQERKALAKSHAQCPLDVLWPTLTPV